ncbi:MAG: hypothetical protein EXS36_08795 [Pedosphaera sp.]|nr:hypothetical protein [Pedosphaera sp.]
MAWVSPGNSPGIPSDWISELAQSRLLVVSAANKGNERAIADRLRLALDATYNVCREFPIERKRIYIGGMSGGGRVASMLGIACADVFAGALCVCGVNYFRDLADAHGQFYPASYRPDLRVLPLAKRSERVALITGEFDPNRENTKDTFEKGFLRDGFKNVRYFEIPGMRHAMPSGGVLYSALNFLDGKDRPRTNSITHP